MSFMYNIIFITLFYFNQNPFGYKEPPAEFDYHKKHFQKEVLFKSFEFSNVSKDHTDELQYYLNTNDTVVLPNKKLYINKNGVRLNRNNVLIGHENSVLKAIPNNEIDFAILHIENVQNISVLGVHVIGDRSERVGTIQGEWGHGISIKNSENVLIHGVKVERTVGDGIYIGQLNNLPSKNIVVQKSFVNNARRNGISITSGVNILIEDVFIGNTNGTKPMYGVDIEPNSNRDFIKDIKLSNVTTFNNEIGGVLISLNKLGRGNQKREISITVSNLKDYYSETGFFLNNITVGVENLKGFININNLELYSNQTPFSFKSSTASNVKIKVRSIHWENQHRKAFIKSNVLRGLRKRKDLIYRN